MTIAEKLTEIEADLGAIKALDQQRDEVVQATGDMVEKLATENATLKARIAELEGGVTPPPVEPPVEPPAPPPTGTTKPKILDEHFTNGVDWGRFFRGEGRSVAAPLSWFAKEPSGGIRIIYVAGRPTDCERTEIGIRASPGTTSENARREPVGSTRLYLLEFVIPNEYKLDDSERDHKRVLFQNHQTGGSNPPLSLELRNGTLRLVLSVTNLRKELLNPSTQKGIPVEKGVPTRLFVKSKWHHRDGSIDAALTVGSKVTRASYRGETCYDIAEGLKTSCGVYLPGAHEGEYTVGYRMEYVILRWAIGDHTNTEADFA